MPLSVLRWTLRPILPAGVLALACGVGIPSLRADLTWTQKTVELQADAKANVIEARFHFTNDGRTPVDIRQIQTSCGCTTAVPEQRHYEPGQSGNIVARFTVDGRVGLQRKLIMVSTGEGLAPTMLTLLVHIPEMVHLEPAAVTWKQGEANAAKTIGVVTVPPAPPLRDVSVQSSDPAVKADLQPATGEGKYRINVVPAATDQPLFVTLTIRGRVGAEEKTFHAYASVRSETSAPAAPLPAKSPAPGRD